MLKVKSFSIEDDKGVNDLLTTYRLASDAHILVSDGKICVPYEDGTEANNAQKRIAVAEQKNIMLREYDILTHSQKVMELQIKGMKSRLEELEVQEITPDSKDTYEKSKEIKYEKKRIEDMINQAESVVKSNKGEIARMENNFKVFDETIASLN